MVFPFSVTQVKFISYHFLFSTCHLLKMRITLWSSPPTGRGLRGTCRSMEFATQNPPLCRFSFWATNNRDQFLLIRKLLTLSSIQKRQSQTTMPSWQNWWGVSLIHPPKVLWKEAKLWGERSQPPDLWKCILCAKFTSPKLQRFYYCWRPKGKRVYTKVSNYFLRIVEKVSRSLLIESLFQENAHRKTSQPSGTSHQRWRSE